MKNLFTSFIFMAVLAFSLNAFAVPKLNSLPGATATIFLDFDGHYVQSSVWNGGNPINCAPSGMSDTYITEAFERVAEDYRPFQINITTDSTVFLAAPLNRRMRVIVTTTSGWTSGVGGIAYVGSFRWGDDTPCFVFSNLLGYSPKKVGECCSHESGHTVGLSHQSKYGIDCNTPIEQYNSGSATAGEIGWAPIMGNSYYRNMSNWNNGPTPYGCTNVQDNLTTITSQNGFGYRGDDYAETLNANTTLLTGNSFNVNGIISTDMDKDAFKFTLAANSNFHFTAVPNSIGPNLDIRVELYSSPTTLIRDYDMPLTMSVTIDTILNAGTYFIKVSGTGNANVSSYGSLGSYTISGTKSALPIHAVDLSGTIDKSKHILNWHIIADEPIKTIEIETSANGSNFSPLTNVAPAADKFSYQPYKSSTVFYRLKVTSVIDQTVYSNTIALRGTASSDKLFNVSTLVQNEIVINAAENYQFMITDINGRTLTTGNGLKGINRVNISNRSNGMYFIQLFSKDQKQTERIIKQ
ncbi:MAG: T9SS type A sorting domain-containing protein [Ferruginibacter sp.]